VIEAERRAAQPVASAHTWVFQFDWATPLDGGRWGAHHGLDVPFSFDNAAIVPEKVGTGADALTLSRRMSDAWLAFARTGRPAAPDLPDWPVYDLATRRTLIFDREVRVASDPRGDERRLFAQVPYVQPGT
jgi:para-nitrobenzyl esterase